MKIVAHSLVKNEDKWIWYSLMSVIDYVDEIMVWDTGSTDNTKSQILNIKSQINSKKIKFRERIAAVPFEITKTRQEMLEETKADWLIILDGDEIWPENAIKKTINTIKASGNKYEFLISRYKNLIGDIYHYQEEKAGRYKIGNYFGNITIRAINMSSIPGLKFDLPYGKEGLFDINNIPIQDRIPQKSIVIEEPYLHATHLRRSNIQADLDTMQRTNKYKYELGLPMEKNFDYPKCFYFTGPSNPWKRRNLGYMLNAAWQTPLKLIKRRILDRLVA